jgi:hypothetical protein
VERTWSNVAAQSGDKVLAEKTRTDSTSETSTRQARPMIPEQAIAGNTEW